MCIADEEESREVKAGHGQEDFLPWHTVREMPMIMRRGSDISRTRHYTHRKAFNVRVIGLFYPVPTPVRVHQQPDAIQSYLC